MSGVVAVVLQSREIAQLTELYAVVDDLGNRKTGATILALVHRNVLTDSCFVYFCETDGSLDVYTAAVDIVASCWNYQRAHPLGVLGASLAVDPGNAEGVHVL